MSKNRRDQPTFHEWCSNTVVVGGKSMSLDLRHGLSFLLSSVYRRRWSGQSLSANTVVVGGNYGRGRGKFSARNAHSSTPHINCFLYLCSKRESIMMHIITITHSAGSSRVREENVKEKRSMGMPDACTGFPTQAQWMSHFLFHRGDRGTLPLCIRIASASFRHATNLFTPFRFATGIPSYASTGERSRRADVVWRRTVS